MKVLQSTTSTSPVLHEVPPVGFEPTQFALVELESTPLDQCAIEAAARNGRTSSSLLVSSAFAGCFLGLARAGTSHRSAAVARIFLGQVGHKAVHLKYRVFRNVFRESRL